MASNSGHEPVRLARRRSTWRGKGRGKPFPGKEGIEGFLERGASKPPAAQRLVGFQTCFCGQKGRWAARCWQILDNEGYREPAPAAVVAVGAAAAAASAAAAAGCCWCWLLAAAAVAAAVGCCSLFLLCSLIVIVCFASPCAFLRWHGLCESLASDDLCYFAHGNPMGLCRSLHSSTHVF